MATNVAPDGSASGSITPAGSYVSGAPADLIDDNVTTGYEMLVGVASATMEVIITLDNSYAIGEIELYHEGDCSFFGGDPYDGAYDWEIFTSSNGVDYSSYMSGSYNLTADDSFDEVESQETSQTISHVKLVTGITGSGLGFGFTQYKAKEIKVWTADLVDVGLRVHSVSIGAKVATSEALRIRVNGVTYGIPFDSNGAVKIYDGTTVQGLQEI